MARKAKEYRWSRLELLPLEIRQRLYSYLGLPVVRRVFRPCPVFLNSAWNTYCNIPSHWAVVETKDGWKIYHRHQNDTLLWSTITTIILEGPGNALLQLPNVVIVEDTPEEVQHHSNPQIYGGFFYSYDGFKASRALLCVNKFVAADVYSLIVRKIEVVFNYQLSSEWIYRGYTDGWWSDWNAKENITSRPMGLSSFPFLFMTHVTLTSRIGGSWEERYPHPSSVFKKWQRTDMAKQALSIRYIAQHCPKLKRFTLMPSVVKIIKTKLSELYAITFGLRELVRMCKKLQKLKLQYLTRDPKPRVASREELEWRDVDDYRFEDGLKGVPVQKNLKFKQKENKKKNKKEILIPLWLREDMVAEWAMDVMMDIRNHKKDYGL
ncbi:uncharacterized protein BDZ99DRAFT_502328 [Mytilinidion resinicola]|uniref:Uncharacterized protein n=1 Tax=Mytilinidion resinicola TaxID=574789 RepID=A0A6A6Y883_9PEZI|nr:uncharacterized protein BDZ99DRAFT_502328 [Mytilinidion resinicola]KAF2804900.1 hypothetical protein BDZ99DRAFT_502328 [Mytilinidion resinicola]